MILPLFGSVAQSLRAFFDEYSRVLEFEDQKNFKVGQDILLAQGERVILKDSAGARWALVVDTSGNLSTVAA